MVSLGSYPAQILSARFTIYGPDGTILNTWKIDKNGEHETDGN